MNTDRFPGLKASEDDIKLSFQKAIADWKGAADLIKDMIFNEKIMPADIEKDKDKWIPASNMLSSHKTIIRNLAIDYDRFLTDVDEAASHMKDITSSDLLDLIKEDRAKMMKLKSIIEANKQPLKTIEEVMSDLGCKHDDIKRNLEIATQGKTRARLTYGTFLKDRLVVDPNTGSAAIRKVPQNLECITISDDEPESAKADDDTEKTTEDPKTAGTPANQQNQEIEKISEEIKGIEVKSSPAANDPTTGHAATSSQDEDVDMVEEDKITHDQETSVLHSQQGEVPMELGDVDNDALKTAVISSTPAKPQEKGEKSKTVEHIKITTVGSQDPTIEPVETVLPVIIKQDPEATYNVNPGLLLLQQAPSEEVNNLNIFLSNPHWDEDMKREAEEALEDDEPLPLVTGHHEDIPDSENNLKEKLGRYLHNRSASATANRTHSAECALGLDAAQPVDNKTMADNHEKMEENEKEEDEDDSLLENDDDQNEDHNDQKDDQHDDLNEEEDEHL